MLLCGESGEVIAEELEEGLQAAREFWYREITTHIKQEKPGWEEFAYNSLLTAITTLLLEGKGAVKGAKASVDAGNGRKTGGHSEAASAAVGIPQPEIATSDIRPPRNDKFKVGWDGRAVVKDATGKSITMDRKKYEFLGYDEKGSPVYQDAEVLREQAEAAVKSEAEADMQTENMKELSQSNNGKPTEVENTQAGVEKTEDRDKMKIGLQFFAKKSQDYPTVILERGEYAHVMSEIATNLTKEQAKMGTFSRAIGEYIYTIENNGFGNYRVIKKTKIMEDY